MLRICRPGLRAAILRDKMADETKETHRQRLQKNYAYCLSLTRSTRERRRVGEGERDRELQKRLRTTFALTKESCYTPLPGVKASKRVERAGYAGSPADINFVFIAQPTGLPLCQRVCIRAWCVCESVSLPNEDIQFTVFCSSIYLFSLHFFRFSIPLLLASVGLIDTPSAFCGSLVVVVVGVVVLYFLAADRDTKRNDNKKYSSNNNKCSNKLAQFPSGLVRAPDSFATDAFLTMNISCQLSVSSALMGLSFTDFKWKECILKQLDL